MGWGCVSLGRLGVYVVEVRVSFGYYMPTIFGRSLSIVEQLKGANSGSSTITMWRCYVHNSRYGPFKDHVRKGRFRESGGETLPLDARLFRET
jgi:hypothetical protein